MGLSTKTGEWLESQTVDKSKLVRCKKKPKKCNGNMDNDDSRCVSTKSSISTYQYLRSSWTFESIWTQTALWGRNIVENNNSEKEENDRMIELNKLRSIQRLIHRYQNCAHLCRQLWSRPGGIRAPVCIVSLIIVMVLAVQWQLNLVSLWTTAN